MSKLFFDHLITFKDIDRKINHLTESQEEKEEIWSLVDDILHHRTLEIILDKLPSNHHHEFLDNFHKRPHDEKFLIDYLKEKISHNIEEILRQELGDLSFEILEEIGVSKTKKKRK